MSIFRKVKRNGERVAVDHPTATAKSRYSTIWLRNTQPLEKASINEEQPREYNCHPDELNREQDFGQNKDPKQDRDNRREEGDRGGRRSPYTRDQPEQKNKGGRS